MNTLKYIFIYDYIPTKSSSPRLTLFIFTFPLCFPLGEKSEGRQVAAGASGGKAYGRGRGGKGFKWVDECMTGAPVHV